MVSRGDKSLTAAASSILAARCYLPYSDLVRNMASEACGGADADAERYVTVAAGRDSLLAWRSEAELSALSTCDR